MKKLNKRQKIAAVAALGAAGLTLSLTACGGSGPKTGNAAEHAAQQADTQTLVGNQPVPGYNYSQIRQNLIDIENAQAAGVQTTTFFFNQGVQDPIQSCPSIGFPIASTTQLTNPEQIIHDGYPNGGAAVNIPQMDPNGVYSGNSTGTYVLCVGGDGKTYANYWEGFVQTVTGPAKWNTSTHSIEMLGSSSYHFSSGRGK